MSGKENDAYDGGKKVQAPRTAEQVAALNRYQQCGDFHPFTCGGQRQDEFHLDGEGVLLATETGWVCPYCDYRQYWAWAFMMKY